MIIYAAMIEDSCKIWHKKNIRTVQLFAISVINRNLFNLNFLFFNKLDVYMVASYVKNN